MYNHTLHFSTIAAQFVPTNAPLQYHTLGSGHIHDTFLITSESASPFVLQRLNTHIFQQPAHIMDTHLKVYQHLAAQPDFPLRLPAPIAALDGNWLVKDVGGSYWRALVFIANTYAAEQAETPQQTQQAAEAVGIFLRSLEGLPPENLVPALPGFHDSLKRLQDFEQAVEENRAKRITFLRPEINFIRAESDVFYLVEQLQFPKRIVHTDPKIGNLLFDKTTHDAVAVLDWDTIMPGAIASDLGDMVRTMAATCAEDEADLKKVGLDLNMFTALVEGFIPPLKSVLTDLEINHLVTGARWIILEQMMRFLTDYLNGDIYYKIACKEHNLVRARNQMVLYQAVKMQESVLLKMVQKIAQLQ